MSTRPRFIVAAGVVLLLAACAARSGPPAMQVPQLEPTLRISGSGTVQPAVQRLAVAYAHENPAARIEFQPGTNSGGAIHGVIEGSLELAMVNRPLAPAEAQSNVEYQPFARDVVAFAVRDPNGVLGLTTRQVQDIFGGSITNWAQVGTAPGGILVLDRDEDESARRLVLLPLMQDRPVRARTVVLTTAPDMISALASTPRSIGYTSMGLLHILQPKDVRALPLDGVPPSAESLLQGKYPWFLSFGLAYRHDVPPPVARFLEFIRGPAAQALLKEYGYAPA